MFLSRLLASLVVFVYLTRVFGVARLAAVEVETLKQIAKTIGNKNWNFSVDPCSGESGWSTPDTTKDLKNAVTCNEGCSTNSTICHVVSIVLKQQNLSGILPPEFARLPYLRDIDLVRNYLSGSIPKEWGSMQQLVNLSLVGNGLTGSIPKELGNISTLKKITVEFNQLSGTIPPELGNLSVIEDLHLTSNYFTGELPGNLAKLTTLKDFRIGANYFTGKIPNFIENWTSLQKLVIQGSGLDGPIPSGIARLGQMIDLRITDLNRSEGTFPPLVHMKNLQTLILRSCNITGPLPEYLGGLSNLNVLDLSFNKLSGEIPSYDGLSMLKFMYLTGNLLTGSVPGWILNKNFDLSYNNFTYGSSSNSSCQHQNLNLFGNFLEGSNSGIVPCLRSFQCHENYSSLYINCGGQEVMINGNTTYEDDTDTAGRANFVQRSGRNWALSSTGHFLDGYRDDSYIRDNVDVHSELIRDARFSPLSLTYYIFCLINGNYTVSLHFAEIIFTDDKTFRSLGRRIFDVYIQGKLVLKDFNIKDAAGGVHKEIINKSTAIVTDQTLEIRFYWAGKGTTGLPERGDYGPLISAISVTPDFVVPSEKGNSISAGIIVGIVAAVAFAMILVLGILWWKGCLWCKDPMDQDLKGLDLQTGSFSLKQIKGATKNFDVANKIGEGGFGSVYKGLLSDGTVIAVKQLSSKSNQGNREFVNEIGMISALQHPHLVKLHGCCIEGSQLLLIYEYMENNSLARALFGPEECQLKLDWPSRHKICIGIARGLAYLHEESRLKIVHRDIKATNVLLDKNLNPKISDFGLAKLDDEENTHISTRIAGTYGYMAPEYAMWGYLTDKVDVYSFGIVGLEIVTGRSATSYKAKEDSLNLLDWALSLKEKGNLMQLVDPRLESNFNEEEVMLMINVAFLCTNVTAAVRPTMSSVVSMLEGKADVQESVLAPRISFDDKELEETKNLFQHSPETSTSNRRSQGISTDGPWTASPSSGDLYPISFSSDYWQK